MALNKFVCCGNNNNNYRLGIKGNQNKMPTKVRDEDVRKRKRHRKKKRKHHQHKKTNLLKSSRPAKKGSGGSKPQLRLTLDQFRLSWIGSKKTIIMIGQRGSGKTTVLLDYLYHNQDIPFVMCICPTDRFNLSFNPHIPSRFIFQRYTPDLVSAFIRRQEKMASLRAKAKIGMANPEYAKADIRGMLIMDDCLAQNKGWKTDEGLNAIFVAGRHVDADFIITLQYQMSIPPVFRSNTDWVFLMNETRATELEKLYNNFASQFPTKALFRTVFHEVTSLPKDARFMTEEEIKKLPRKCLVLRMGATVCLETAVYWFQAKIRNKKFRLGYERCWKNNQYYLRKRMNEPLMALHNMSKAGKKQQPQKQQHQKGKKGAVETAPHIDSNDIRADYMNYVGNRGPVDFEIKLS